MSRSIQHLSASRRQRAPLLGVLCAACLAGALLLPSGARAQEVRHDLWGTDGIVDAVVYANDLVYIGGNFTRVGPPTGGFAGVDLSSGQTLAPYALLNGVVHAQVPDGNGGWFIGGTFSSIQGQTRYDLAHLGADGSLTSWDPNASGPPSGSTTIFALALSGNTLYVGGTYSHLGGQTRNGLAAVDATTGALLSWDPFGSTINQNVSSLLVSGSTLYVGGSFGAIGGQVRSDIAAIDIGTGSVTAWNPGADGAVDCMILGPYAGTLTVGGAFTHIGGQARARLAMLDATTGQPSSWNPGPNGTVLALGFDPKSVYVGGQFTSIGVIPLARNHIAAIDPSNGAALSWDPNANSDVRALAVRTILPVSQTTVYIGGAFSAVGGAERHFLAAIDGSGTATAWAPYCSGPYSLGAYSIGLSGSAVFAGGDMSLVGSVPRSSLAAIDATSGIPTDWNPGPSGSLSTTFYGAPVQALLLDGSTLCVGGNFTSIGGQAHDCLAAVDALSGAPISWNLDAGPEVTSMARIGNTVYVGGGFSSLGGVARLNAGSFDATTGAVSGWNPDFDNKVRALTVRTLGSYPFTRYVYAGGDFINVGGVSRPYLADVDGTTGALQSWNASMTQSVYALAYSSCGVLCAGTIWAGGPFSVGTGGFQHYMAAFDAGTAALKPWDPQANGTVESIFLYNGIVYAGGTFTSIGGASRMGAAALNGGTALASSWNPEPSNADILAFGAYADDIYMGGSYTTMLGASEWNFGGVSDGSVTAAPESPTPPAPLVVHATPNPFGASTSLQFTLAQTEPADVAVYSVTGRLVRHLRSGVLPAGRQSLEWDGRDDEGRAVGSGVYLFRVRTPSQRLTGKLLRLK